MCDIAVLHGERITLRGPRESDVDDRLGGRKAGRVRLYVRAETGQKTMRMRRAPYGNYGTIGQRSRR